MLGLEDKNKEGGKALAEARKKKGMTQSEVAEAIGVSVSHYCHLEQGTKSVFKMSGPLRKALKDLLGFEAYGVR